MKQLSPVSVMRLKVATFIACLVPFVHVSWGVLTGSAGADPVEALTHSTGLWALRLLLLTLALSPLRKLTGWSWVLRLRRILALYSFFYAMLHTLVYLAFEQSFDWISIASDILKRPWLTAGFFSFVLMIPLAATSTNGMMRRLGRNWQRLHRLIYPIAVGAVLHYFWLVKKDITAPSIYAVVLAILFCARLVDGRKGKSTRTPVSRPGAVPFVK